MIRRARPLLGTIVEIGVKPVPGQEDAAVVAIAAAFEQIASIEKLLSFHRADSDLSRINCRPGTWVSAGSHCIRVLRLARALGRVSGELFNCTVGGAVVNRGALPAPAVDAFAASGVSSDIEIKGNTVRLSRPVLITLDGIAKGYAVDMAIAELKKSALPGAWVNAGGDMRVFGDISLAVHQRRSDGVSAPVSIKNLAVASSRIAPDSSREFPAAVITPTKLAPDGEFIVSVGARFAWRADALTKVAGSLPRDKRDSAIKKLGGILLDFSSASPAPVTHNKPEMCNQ